MKETALKKVKNLVDYLKESSSTKSIPLNLVSQISESILNTITNVLNVN